MATHRTLRSTAVTTALAATDWIARRDAHQARVRGWTRPHQQRRARGEKHPVLDFLSNVKQGHCERYASPTARS